MEGCNGVQAGDGATLLEKCGKVRGKHQQRWDNLQMKGEGAEQKGSWHVRPAGHQKRIRGASPSL